MSQKSRLPLYAGAAAVSAVGYYLYSAGGSPKVAEKKFERKSINSGVDWHWRNSLTDIFTADDVSSASARLRGQQVSGKEAEKKGEELAHRAGSAIDSTVSAIVMDHLFSYNR